MLTLKLILALLGYGYICYYAGMEVNSHEK